MNATNSEHLKTHADLQWCIDVLERIDDILKRSPISAGDIRSIEWLVKQGLKCKKEE